MEKLPHEEYRDELADKLKDIRNSDQENPDVAKAKAQGYLEAKKETEEYTDAKEDHDGERKSNRLKPVLKSILKDYLTSKDGGSTPNEICVEKSFHQFNLDIIGAKDDFKEDFCKYLVSYLNKNKEVAKKFQKNNIVIRLYARGYYDVSPHGKNGEWSYNYYL